MNKKEKTVKMILVWMLACASLLVALLYSPLGSPDIYQNKDYFAEYQGVQFNGKVENAPRNLNNTTSNGYIVPEHEEAPTNYQTIAYSGNSGLLAFNSSYLISSKQTESTISSGAIGAGLGSVFSNFGGNHSESKNIFGSPQVLMSGFGIGSFRGLFGSIFSKESNPSTTTQAHGFFAITTDLPIVGIDFKTGNESNIFKSDSNDPGDGPIGEPVPVGDGWMFLIGLALVYMAWKRFGKKQLI